MDPSNRRGLITQVRLSEEERARVDAVAKSQRLKLSEWMREILLANAPLIE